MSERPDVIAHTGVSHRDGRTTVQHFGPSHIVPGSELVVDVPDGFTVVIRHLRPDGTREPERPVGDVS